MMENIVYHRNKMYSASERMYAARYSGELYENLFVPVIVDVGSEESRSSIMVYAQYNGNETELKNFHNIWMKNKTKMPESSWMEEQSTVCFGKGLGSIVLPESLDEKYLLSETQVGVLTKMMKRGPYHYSGTPVYRALVLQGKYTIDNKVLQEHLKGREDCQYNWDVYQSLCGKWD